MPQQPILLRAWWRLLEIAHVRSYRFGDSKFRYVVTEPWDAAVSYRGRVACRVLHLHGLTCRGRRDHSPYEGRWARNGWL